MQQHRHFLGFSHLLVLRGLHPKSKCLHPHIPTKTKSALSLSADQHCASSADFQPTFLYLYKLRIIDYLLIYLFIIRSFVLYLYIKIYASTSLAIYQSLTRYYSTALVLRLVAAGCNSFRCCTSIIPNSIVGGGKRKVCKIEGKSSEGKRREEGEKLN